MAKKETAVRKRAQITKENRTMFIWVAAASVIVGFALVASIFLIQVITFNEKVLAAKNTTVSTLKNNNNAVSDLENNIRVLDTNEVLAAAKAQSDDETLQVVLDALPSEANSLAVGSSLQNRLLANTGITGIEAMQVDPVAGVETVSTDDYTTTDNTTTVSSESSIESGIISFSFKVTGSQESFKNVLLNLEKSIRTINPVSLKIEQDSSVLMMTVEAQAFYQPARTITLKDKVIKQ